MITKSLFSATVRTRSSCARSRRAWLALAAAEVPVGFPHAEQRSPARVDAEVDCVSNSGEVDHPSEVEMLINLR